MTIFTPANGLVVFDAFARPEPGKNRRFFLEMIGRNNDRDGFAYDLFGLVAKDPFGAFVPTSNDAVQSFTDDGVIRRFD